MTTYIIQRQDTKKRWKDALTGSSHIEGTLQLAFAIYRMGHKVRVMDNNGHKIWPFSLHDITSKMEPLKVGQPVMITDEFWSHLIQRQGMDVPEWLPLVTTGTIATINHITPNTFREKFPIEIYWKIPEEDTLYSSWVWYGVADRMRRAAYAMELGFTFTELGDWQR